MDAAAVQGLERYFQRIGDVLEEESRRGSFALYALGLLGDGERKSVEPMAAIPTCLRRAPSMALSNSTTALWTSLSSRAAIRFIPAHCGPVWRYLPGRTAHRKASTVAVCSEGSVRLAREETTLLSPTSSTRVTPIPTSA